MPLWLQTCVRVCVCVAGSDVGGSIRMPAFFNGVFGHKPSSGLVPNSGQHPIAHGVGLRYLSTGPICRCVCVRGPHMDRTQGVAVCSVVQVALSGRRARGFPSAPLCSLAAFWPSPSLPCGVCVNPPVLCIQCLVCCRFACDLWPLLCVMAGPDGCDAACVRSCSTEPTHSLLHSVQGVTATPGTARARKQVCVGWRHCFPAS